MKNQQLYGNEKKLGKYQNRLLNTKVRYITKFSLGTPRLIILSVTVDVR